VSIVRTYLRNGGWPYLVFAPGCLLLAARLLIDRHERRVMGMAGMGSDK
jgi:hypothetical protein